MRKALSDAFEWCGLNLLYRPMLYAVKWYSRMLTDDAIETYKKAIPTFEMVSGWLCKVYDIINGDSHKAEDNRLGWEKFKRKI